jgi:hypothetical protein
MPAYHLAQVNIGRVRDAIDSPLLADFVAALPPINTLADESPGFVWRLQTEDGDATSIRPFEDETILVNMSVWESIETLGDFVYRSAHTPFMRRRREWFHHMDLYIALWWVEAGTIPDVMEAKVRLEHLEKHGPTPFAFTFRQPFPPPDGESTIAPYDEACPA